MNLRHLTGIALVAAVALMRVSASRAQISISAKQAEDSMKQLIVRIDTDTGFGSGIIFAATPKALYVATANHVVRRGGSEAKRIEVKFRAHPDQAVAAKLLSHHDDALDLAVISVVERSQLWPNPATLPFDRQADPSELNRGDALFMLGHPNGLPWRINTTAERFIERRGDLLDFESNLIAPGHSGGALLNEDRDLLGLLRSDQAPYGEAASILSVAERLRVWGYKVEWRFPRVQISAGDELTCLLEHTGRSRCWGFDPRVRTSPLTLTDVQLKAISAGSGHVCGIAGGGAAWCVGLNGNGQLGGGSKDPSFRSPTQVQGALKFVSISAGFGHTCGVVTSGEAYCWGGAGEGQLGDHHGEARPSPVRVPGTIRFKTVSASFFYSCGLSTAGKAYCWGSIAGAESSPSGVVTVAEKLMFDSLVTGYHHMCGLTGKGDAHCWGFNDHGQFGDGTTSKKLSWVPTRVSGLSFRSLSAGVAHTCGVTANGMGYCWGLNNFGQLGDGTKTNRPKPTPVTGGLSFDSISAGNLHTCGVTRDSAVFCWGHNNNGQVGVRGKEEQLSPWRVPADALAR